MSAHTWSGVEAAEMATGEGIIIAEVMATGETKLKSVQTTLNGGIVILLLLLVIYMYESSLKFYTSCLKVGL